jgi:hypothetical protein
MKESIERLSIFALVLLSLGFTAAQAQNAPNTPQSMRFFVTSVGSGKGGEPTRTASRLPPRLERAREHGRLI